MNTDNIRYQKTEQKILDTFFELMKTKGFENIRVNDILKSANISKSTFYVHYHDKYEVLNHFEDSLLSRCTEEEKSTSAVWIREHPNFSIESVPHLKNMIHHIYLEGEKYAVLLSDKGDRIVFTEKLQNTIHSMWKRLLITSKETIPQNYALCTVESVACGLIQEWVKGGCKENEEEFKTIWVEIFQHLTPNLIRKVTIKEN